MSANNGFVSQSGAYLYITGAGTYEFFGSATNLQIQVNASGDDVVDLVFSGVTIANTKNSPVYIINADKTNIYLSEGTINTFTDATSYTYEDAVEEDPKAAIFSSDDLNIRGSGTLIVNGRFNNGIHSSNDLRFKGSSSSYPKVTVTAVNNALKGKDSVEVDYAELTLISTAGDAIQADTEDESDKGYVLISDGIIDITSARDAIQGYRYVQIDGGTITAKSGKGSSYSVTDSQSYKGIKSDLAIIINGGTISLNSQDDALHSNGTITINGGTITISSGDDGIHGDTTVTINGGTININKSYEGIEGLTINIAGGTTHVISSDDGINARTDTSIKPIVNISDGYLYINASGDGLDSNGSIYITGGTTIVNGPTVDNNGPIDKGDGSGSIISITGGLLVAVGSKGMAVGPTTGSQYSALIGHSSVVGSSSLYVITDSNNTHLVAFKPAKNSYSICVSSPYFSTGTYKLYSGGSYANATSTTDGLYQGGVYTPGTQLASWTFSTSNVHYSTGVGGGGGPR
ncbi:MAG TPA: carbohydrate-binding domain-containing protein [Bacilli bacterium]|nr:carbohydrate-binding domain-containing protein [Bacilli bacterium]